jgi:atypical dual specificity phosphatase
MHTGFLDSTTGRDIVDCYELWVRLSHLTHRGEAIVAAGDTTAPSLVHPQP